MPKTGSIRSAVLIIIIYLLRPKAAQHNITITKTVEKHKKLKSKIHKKIRINKANHTANETVVHGSVHNSFFVEW